MTNLLVILGILTVCFGAYYVFTATDSAVGLSDTRSEAEMQAMLNRTQVFIDRRQVLSGVRYDFGIFNDDSFLNLESFRLPITEQLVGRPNPFERREEGRAPGENIADSAELIQ